MQDGDTVFVMFAGCSHMDAQVLVWEATVVNAAENVVKDAKTGRVRVLEDFECVYQTEERAWEEAAGGLLAMAHRIRSKADECLKQAARCRIVHAGGDA